MTPQNLIEDLQRQSIQKFLEEYLFDKVPHVFANDRAAYVAWKRVLSQALDVDAACLTIVGSAAFGCSLNPTKNFKAFDDQSDIDVAVISNHHFSIGWRYLRMNGGRRLRVDRRTQIAWDDHVHKYIYWGTIATDKLLGVLPFGKAWMEASTRMSLVDPSRDRDVKFRVYADYESLRAYQSNSVSALRQSLFK